jgi:hypothetical protein
MLGFLYRRVREAIIFSAQSKMEYIMNSDPNDDRSDSMNPNNDAYQDSMDNRSDQLNPNNDEYQGSEDEED